ncbi:MAG: TRAP transporter fused permease subunit [Dehalobacterium sp.]
MAQNETNAGSLVKISIAILAVFAVIIHIYTGGFGLLSTMELRATHWLIFSLLAFLVYPFYFSKKKICFLDKIINLLFIIAAFSSSAYILLNWERIVNDAGAVNSLDVAFGVVMVIVVLEATRRTIGGVLTGIIALFLLYAFVGQYFPGVLQHGGYSLKRIISFLYTTTEGIYGSPIGASAGYIALFIFFGGFLNKLEAGDFLFDLSYRFTCRLRGGPAKTAVVSSFLMGTMMGAAVANVSTTGTFTIPMMKKNGFKATLAASIEALSSTGGQFLPPVMAGAAFVVAEFTGKPYIDVMRYAFIPAALYFISVYRVVDIEAIKAGLLGVEKPPKTIKEILAKGYYYAVPILALIVLLAMGYSPQKTAVISIFSLVICYFLWNADKRRSIFKLLLEGCVAGAKSTIKIAVSTAGAGIIVGVLGVTGLGIKLSTIVLGIAGDNLFIALILTALLSIILGMGLPTVAAYVILAVVAAPVLIEMGVPVLAAHMFIFFFGCFSTITPPVALSSYAAAAIADANPDKVGWLACRLALGGFMAPFMIVYSPGLRFEGDLLSIILALSSSLIGILAFTSGITGFITKPLNKIQQLLLVIGSLILLVSQNISLIAIGIVLVGLAIFKESKEYLTKRTALQKNNV